MVFELNGLEWNALDSDLPFVGRVIYLFNYFFFFFDFMDVWLCKKKRTTNFFFFNNLFSSHVSVFKNAPAHYYTCVVVVAVVVAVAVAVVIVIVGVSYFREYL